MMRRLFREGLVLRSLVFPTVLTAGTLLLTIGIAAWVRWQPIVAISPDLSDLVPALREKGIRPIVVDDPEAAVLDRTAWGAATAHEVILTGGGPHALVLESLVRQRAGASWRPDDDVPRPPVDVALAMGNRIVVLLGALFSLYGVVFGIGMVARDRDAGTLEIELSLPVPRWVHGAARLITGTLSLSLFLTLGIFMVEAVIGLTDSWALVRHGIACACGATCIGLLAIGRAGLENGFTGPLAFGMALATGLLATGLGGAPFAEWLPLASFATRSSGWEALIGATLLAIPTVWIFTMRSARA
jgi:hypothetical protein